MKRDLCCTASATGAYVGLRCDGRFGAVDVQAIAAQLLHPEVAAVTETCLELGEAKR